MAGIRLITTLLALMVYLRCCCNGQDTKGQNTKECDFVIIGAGTASLALGGLLAKIPYWTVCILERGPMEKRMTGWYTNNYKFTSPHDPLWFTQPTLRTLIDGRNKNKDGRNIYIPRFRGRGGTARVYGAINRRASPDVLDMWPQGWKHEDLSHYYKLLEDHYCYYDSEESTGIPAEECKKWHGKGGPMQINPQMKEAFDKFSTEMESLCKKTTMPWNGYASDYNGPLEGRISCSVFQQFKLRKSRADRASQTSRGSSFTGYYETENNNNNKPYLYTSTTVTKILFENGKAVGVLCLNGTGETVLTVRARKEVILGGGAFDTPHLLQVSGVGPENVLKKIKVDIVAVNSHVGQNLWDHISVPYVLKLSPESDDLCCTNDAEDTPTVTIDGNTYETKKLNSINGPFSWILHLRSNLTRSPRNMADIQLYVMGNSKLFDETGSLGTTSTSAHSDMSEYNFCGEEDENTNNAEDYNEGTIRIIDQWPEYRGSVKAVTSNIFDRPELEYGWTYLSNEKPTDEFQQISKLFRDQIRMLRDMFFGDNVPENLRKLIVGEVAPGKEVDTDDELNAWMRGMLVSALHPVGTCKMPECADEFLRVKGVTNLRVCDASAFATQTDGNPAATLYAMGEKLADMLKYQYLKYIKVVVRQDSVHGRNGECKVDKSVIESDTNCIDVSVTCEWVPTGKDTTALIYKWSLLCSEDSNEREIADIVSKATLDVSVVYGCSADNFPKFNLDGQVSNKETGPMHGESSYLFLVWCQKFELVSDDNLWTSVGAWKGEQSPGSKNCFKLNCQEEICSFLVKYNDVNMELVYSEPDLSLPVTDYISTKKVESRHNGESSVYFRTGSMRSNPGSDWNWVANYLLENVYAISGQRLSRKYPPQNSQNGWWSERSDGLLYYETKGIFSNTKIAGFDLDGTIIKTKSGNTFPQDENDWEFRFAAVPEMLQQNHYNGINNVIISNQYGIGLGKQNKGEWMAKVENIISQLGVPIYVIASINDNEYRKPEIGMWEYYSCTLNQFKTIDKTSAVYVGDSAGRPKDHSDSDKQFAKNVGIKFDTPEEYFVPSSKPYQAKHDDL